MSAPTDTKPGDVSRDVRDRLQEARQAVEDARSRLALAQAQEEGAQASLETVRAALAEEFGVSTPAQAREAVAELDRQITTAMSEIEVALTRAQVQEEGAS